MKEAYFVGLDVHSKETVFAVMDAAGAVVERGSLPTREAELRAFAARVAGFGPTLVGLETGNSSFFVAGVLLELGIATRVIDAHEVRTKAHRPTQKCDRRDAFEIADGLRRDLYRSIVHVPPMHAQELRLILSRRRHFVRLQAAEMIAAKRSVRAAGLADLVRRSLRTELGWKTLQRELAKRPEQALLLAFVVAHHDAWVALGAQVVRLERLLAEHVERLAPAQRAQIERLDRIPGFGRIVATTVYAILFDAQRFASSKHVGSYAGFTPQTWQSGERDAHGHITRRGSLELRAMLCEAAHCCRRASHPLEPYLRKLTARRGNKVALIAVAHRLLRIAWRLLHDQVEFDPSKLGVEPGPFEQKVVREWRLKRHATPRGAETN